ELWHGPRERSGGALPLEIALRVLLDVLEGLGALHKLCDAQGRRLKHFHGEVTAANVLVGLDGVSRLLRACRVRLPGDVAPSGAEALPPEVRAGGPADQRADVFGVGVLLWQALSGRSPFGDEAMGSIVDRPPSEAIERATVPNRAPWAAPLVDVAAR